MDETEERSASAMNTTRQRNLLLTLVTFLSTSPSPAAGQIRLAGPKSTPCSGTVEIHHSGTWGTVCDDGWDLKDAQVVCRQLGCGGAMTAVQSAAFGQGTGVIWLSRVTCSGDESSLTQCSHGGFGAHACGHGDDAGVVCSGVLVRVAGSTLCSGRVEINHNGVWGTVCDDSWDLPDAEVVCRQMNCGAALNATPAALFGSGGGKVWLNHVACSGSEGSLTQCQHRGFGKHDCRRNEGAGVVCSVSLPKPNLEINPAGEVTWGHDVVITCSTLALLTGGRFILQRTEGSFTQTKTAVSNSATFKMRGVDFAHDGLYTCQHEISISGSRFYSSLSDSAEVSVVVSLQRPTISVTPADSGPDCAQLTSGHGFVLICSVNSSYTDGRFFLTSSGRSVSAVKPAVNNSASFDFPTAERGHRSNFTCVYEVALSTRRFNSTEAAPICVIMKTSLLLPISFPVVGLLLLLLLLLVVFLVCRRSRRIKQPVGLRQSQMLWRDRIATEDDDVDYVNIDIVNCKKNLKETKDAVEKESEYEEPLRHGSGDYEDAELRVNYTEARWMFVNVEANRGDEETSDDECEYENVILLLDKQIEDGDEEIYENF